MARCNKPYGWYKLFQEIYFRLLFRLFYRIMPLGIFISPLAILAKGAFGFKDSSISLYSSIY
jgi:hypothetical protein